MKPFAIFAVLLPPQLHIFSSRPPEWMLERGKWQDVGWTGPERGNLWLWQPVLLLQPDRTGVCPCVHVTNCLLLFNMNLFFLRLSPESVSSVQQLCGGTLLQTQVHRTEQVPDPGVWLWMGGLSSRGHHSGNMTQQHTVWNYSIEHIRLCVRYSRGAQHGSSYWCQGHMNWIKLIKAQ